MLKIMEMSVNFTPVYELFNCPLQRCFYEIDVQLKRVQYCLCNCDAYT